MASAGTEVEDFDFFVRKKPLTEIRQNYTMEVIDISRPISAFNHFLNVSIFHEGYPLDSSDPKI